MQIISRRTLIEYWKKFPDTEQALKSWFHEARQAEWKTPQDIKDQYAHASILANNRVVFNIRGNNYRLIVRVNYKSGALFIRFIGTHEEYDEVDVETI